MPGERLAILGVGLLGGSVALAARAAGIAAEVVGCDRSPDALRIALDRGIIDRSATPVEAVAGADLVVLAVPVDRIVALVREVAPHCRPGTLLTDVGSTKGFVREAEVGLPSGVAFVGGHPLAGSEKSGPAHARADLFRGRRVVLTPTERSDPSAVERLRALWRDIGADVTALSPEAHDEAVAWTSHLPHLVAYALAGCLPPEFADLVATGFRDTTRLASSDPALWVSILTANREAVLAALAGFRRQFDKVETALRTGAADDLARLLGEGNAARDRLPD